MQTYKPDNTDNYYRVYVNGKDTGCKITSDGLNETRYFPVFFSDNEVIIR